MRYGAGIVKWTKEELEKLDRQTRKIMTMNGALHPKSDVDRPYVVQQRGGRVLQSVLETILSEESSLRRLLKNSCAVTRHVRLETNRKLHKCDGLVLNNNNIRSFLIPCYYAGRCKGGQINI